MFERYRLGLHPLASSRSVYLLFLTVFLSKSLALASPCEDQCQKSADEALAQARADAEEYGGYARGWSIGQMQSCIEMCEAEQPFLSKDNSKESLPGPDVVPDPGKGNKTPPEGDKSATQSCTENFDTEVSTCEQATLKAAKSCDENSSGLSSVANMASQATLLAGQKGSMGIQESCSKMASVAKAASLALISYRQLCSSAVSVCESKCSVSVTPKCGNSGSQRVTDARSAMAGNASSCKSFSAKMAEAAAAAQNYAMMHTNSQACASLTSGTGAPGEICKTDPDYPGCAPQEKMDCTNPKMASNKVCICSKSPSNPICTSQQENTDNRSPVISDRGSSPGKGKSFAEDSNISSKSNSLSGGEGAASAYDAVDGRQGESSNLSGGNLTSTMEKRLKEKRGIKDQSVTDGFYSSGASGSSAEKRYESLKLESSVQEKGSPKGKETGDVDLRKFLPGTYNPNGFRGVAGGIEKVGPDGITGPHGDIWEKIRNRYQSLRDSLQP